MRILLLALAVLLVPASAVGLNVARGELAFVAVPTPVPGLKPDITEFTWLPDGRLAYTNRSGPVILRVGPVRPPDHSSQAVKFGLT